jgi:hypothetical protein
MVLQVLTYASKVSENWYPEPRQQIRGSDSGKLE